MSLAVAWDSLDRAGWESLFAQALRSALVQSWAWGEAKREEEGWRPRRALVSLDGRPVALAQVLEKRKAGLVRLGRLNRGPVWLGEPDESLKRAVLGAVCRPWRVWRGAALALAPELADGLAPPAFARRRAAPAWASAWLELGPPAEEIRRRLDGKWRNMLNGAERAGLEVEDGPALLPWMLERHAAQMADKGFDATPPALVAGLGRHAARPDDLLVLRAVAQGVPVGGLLVVRHGACATYLIGWSDAEGRKRRATHFLLWQAVRALKERGVERLDLGGIDAALTPGIAAFKRGMNGTEYRLAGEFVVL